MDYNFKVGRISTMFIYLLEGFIAIIIALFFKHINISMIIQMTVAWLIGFVVMAVIRYERKNHVNLFWVCEILFITALSLFLTVMFEHLYLIFLLFFLHWIANMLFLQRRVCYYLMAVQGATITIMTFLLNGFSLIEYVCAGVVFAIGLWFTINLINILNRQKDLNAEQQQSLDDMLKLVDVKFNEARNANKAKSSFLANMSHEIRTPINTVLGLDTMILRTTKDEQIKKYALDIQSAGQSLLSIINDILDFSKIESGKMEIIEAEYEVSSLINDVSNMMATKIADKGLTLSLNIDSKLPCRLKGDDVRIRQILVNLLTNAVKYTNEGSITLTIGGQIEDDVLQMYFSVKDTGIGIKEEDLDKLFSEFVRIEEKRNRNIEGTGLGINIVTQLLELMDGKLEVTSVYGEGSDFYFTIPQKIVNYEPIGDLEKRISEQTKTYSYSAKYKIPGSRLLVVDDNSMNLLVFTELLKGLECRIDQAGSGKECLELVSKNSYDIIFLDDMMPEMDGRETLHIMREWKHYPNENTPVIALTANAVAGAREGYLAEGFYDYLSKPINSDKLEKMIARIIPDERKVICEGASQDERGNEMPCAEGEIHSEDCRKGEAIDYSNVPADSSDDLPVIDGVDWNYALIKLRKKELLQQVVDDFSIVAANDMTELNAKYELLRNCDETAKKESYQKYRVKVHSMKTTTAMFGALGVSSLAKILEYAARDEDGTTIDVLHGIFEREWNSLQVSVVHAFGKDNLENRTLTDTGSGLDAATLLQMLDTAMESLDVDTADSVVNELQKFYSDYREELVNDISVAVRNLDAKQVHNLIMKWQ